MCCWGNSVTPTDEETTVRLCHGEVVEVIEVTCPVGSDAEGWLTLLNTCADLGKMLQSATLSCDPCNEDRFIILGYTH